jgi:uncharacterized caspase-like protein
LLRPRWPRSASRRSLANDAYKGAPRENPTVDADRVAASLTNIAFVVKVMKNVDLDEFDRGVTEFAREANGVDVALFEPHAPRNYR